MLNYLIEHTVSHERGRVRFVSTVSYFGADSHHESVFWLLVETKGGELKEWPATWAKVIHE